MTCLLAWSETFPSIEDTSNGADEEEVKGGGNAEVDEVDAELDVVESGGMTGKAEVSDCQSSCCWCWERLDDIVRVEFLLEAEVDCRISRNIVLEEEQETEIKKGGGYGSRTRVDDWREYLVYIDAFRSSLQNADLRKNWFDRRLSKYYKCNTQIE